MQPRQILSVIGLAWVLACAAPATGLEAVGVTLGVDGTKLAGDEPRNFRYQADTGFKAGLVVEFALARDVRLSLQPGYLRTATKIAFKDEAAGDVRDSLGLNLDWIQVPIIVRVMTGGALFATGGLDVAFLVGGGIDGGEQELPASTFFKDVDLAAVFGVGAEFPVGRYRLNGELRYRQGLVNLARESLSSRLDALPPRFRFAGFQLQVGLMLPLGGR